MADRGPTARTKRSRERSARAWPGGGATRQVAVLALVGLAVFVFLSLVSFAPPLSGEGNWCGRLGAAVAGPILSALGFSAFLLVGLGAFWGGAALAGRRFSRPWLKVAGVVLLTLAFGALIQMILGPDGYRAGHLSGPGGRLGYGLADRLTWLAGDAGAFVIALVTTLIGLTLATDWLFLQIGRDAVDAATKLYRSIVDGAPRVFLATATSLRAAWTLVPATGFGSGSATAKRPHHGGGAGAPSPSERLARKTRRQTESRAEEGESRPREEAKAPAKGLGGAAEDDSEQGSLASRPRREAPAAPSPTTPALFEGIDEVPAEEAPARRASPRPRTRRARSGGQPWTFPPPDLLDPVKRRDPRAQEAMIKENAEILEETLREFKVEAEVVAYTRGPVVTLYELDLAAGIKVNRIHNLSEDLAVALKAPSVRVVAPLPGKSTIGVEVPNPARDDVRIPDLLETGAVERSSGSLPLLLGADVAGNPLIEDLTTMPHCLIAGSTGSGKSVCINSILVSLLLNRTPEEVRMILIDPKQVELSFFQKVPHLLSPVVVDMKKVVAVLEWVVDQMEERYALFHSMEVRNIHSFNDLDRKEIAERKRELGITEEDEESGLGFPDRLPYIVVVVDELADLMMNAGKEIENLITRLAQKSRAVGIHIILATQRPSTDVITGLIKANMPCRLSFQVASKIDSRVILDQNGAEKLLGRGDMLYLPPRTSHLVRAQGTFVSDGEVKRIVKFLADRSEQEFEESLTQAQSGNLLDDDEKDPLYDEAVRIILSEQRGSASLLQRALGVGYTRGSRLMDQMHKEGLVGPYKGSKAREVLFTEEEYEKLVQARK